MLLAELHGKGLSEAQNHEDYLTSAVFGHLRYICPAVFWEDLFLRARTRPNAHGHVDALSTVITGKGRPISTFESLRLHFWPNHPSLGEPDLVLCFRFQDAFPLVILLEAKLFSGKSGFGEWDQLVRYLKLLDDLPTMRLDIPGNSMRFLVYLTPRDAGAEVEESLRLAGKRQADRERLFLLRWQDVGDVAHRWAQQVGEPSRTILSDVYRFLSKRGLEFFDGFRQMADLPEIEVCPLTLAGSPRRGFQGFKEVANFDHIAKCRGEWTK